MASGSANMTVEDTPPTPTQLLFAKVVIYTFDLWPALRLAISEQWGGIESKAKADFLISYICDQYSQEPKLIEQVTSSSAASINPPATPDVDDLAEILEGYFADEYESRLEDESADWVAARIVQLHKVIYSTFPATQESLDKANEEISKLEQASVALRGKKVTAETTESDSGESISEGEEGNEVDAMEVDAELNTSAVNSSRTAKTEPIVDEEGFTTVVKGKRR